MINKDIRITLPRPVRQIIQMLEEHGHEAYAVGGCVRDSILGKIPNDWDVTTSASPDEIKACLKKTIDTGIEHGTVTVRLYGESYEVTTYRIDGEYEDARHPKDVTFTKELKEDLMRRDFTVNAMAYHPQNGIVDLFGGMEDLFAGRICCVGSPLERFTEDALRMLRAIRFSSQLAFTIEDETYAAICSLAENIEKISMERIRTEIEKILVSQKPDGMRMVYETGLSAHVLPELDQMFATEQKSKHHLFSVGEHTMVVLANLPPDRILRLAGLFHDIAKPITKRTDHTGEDHFVGHPQVGVRMTREIMRRMKFDNASIDTVSRLVCYHDERPPAMPRNVRRLAGRIGPERMEDLFQLKEADIAGQSDYHKEEKLNKLAEYRRVFAIICEEDDCMSIKDLAIGGNDLIGLGIPKGPEIGEILKRLLSVVIDDPACNTKEELLRLAVGIHHSLRGE